MIGEEKVCMLLFYFIILIYENNFVKHELKIALLITYWNNIRTSLLFYTFLYNSTDNKLRLQLKSLIRIKKNKKNGNLTLAEVNFSSELEDMKLKCCSRVFMSLSVFSC